MTDYNNIPDGWVDPESPGITSLFFYLRDNPIAMFEAAPGAPRLRAGAVAAPAAYLSYGDQNQGAVSYPSDTTIAPGLISCTSFDIPTGVTVSVRRPDGDDATKGPLIILCSGTVTINGTLNADGMGEYGQTPTEPAYGVGNGWLCIGGGGGAAYGDDTSTVEAFAGAASFSTPGGQISGSTAGNGQSPIQSVRDMGLFFPFALLSGGAGGARARAGDGGDGGGAIVIVAADMVFNGAIEARGIDGFGGLGTDAAAGGGGGGVVIRFAKTYSVDAGVIDVSGGAGDLSAGGTSAGGSHSAGNGGPGWSKKITEGAF